MLKTGSFCIEYIFEIKGRGIVFGGRIVDGFISSKNYLRIITKNKTVLLKIKSIEGIRHSRLDNVNTGLVLDETVIKLDELKDLIETPNTFEIISCNK